VQFLMIMYAAVVLGGLGSILGAFWGGVIIGFVQQVSTLFLPLELQSAAIFVVCVTTLFFLPQGLFGRSGERI
jgi:branched-chain amino acid transport system permease protein